jgi:hypothetical protein
MRFPTKFRDGHSKYKFMYEGIVIREIIFPPGQSVEEGCQDGQSNHEVHAIKIVVVLQQEGESQR